MSAQWTDYMSQISLTAGQVFMSKGKGPAQMQTPCFCYPAHFIVKRGRNCTSIGTSKVTPVKCKWFFFLFSLQFLSRMHYSLWSVGNRHRSYRYGERVGFRLSQLTTFVHFFRLLDNPVETEALAANNFGTQGIKS